MAATAQFSDNERLRKITEFDESKAGVKGLSDSDITTIPDFFVHSPEILSDLKSSSPCTTQIPVIDLSVDHRQKLIEQIREAASSWGFFQVINHGVPVSVLNQTIKAVKAFHEQPAKEKAKYYIREEERGVMYSSNYDLYRANAASWLDTLQSWMAPVPPELEEIPEVCRKETVEWDMYATKVAETVMELLSQGLGLDAGKFKELSFCGTRAFVGHIYPYCPQPDLTVGITPHTDPGVVTVLLQNEVQGLQVKHGQEWVDVKPLPGGLIINIGDLLQIVSNGEYQSVQHRVLANGSRDPRISVVMFFNISKWRGSGGGPDECHYGPLPELLSPEKPPMYRDFTMQEFLDNFYKKGLDSKSLIDKITVCN